MRGDLRLLKGTVGKTSGVVALSASEDVVSRMSTVSITPQASWAMRRRRLSNRSRLQRRQAGGGSAEYPLGYNGAQGRTTLRLALPVKRLPFLLLTLALVGAGALPSSADPGKITVFAAASLREAFEAAAPAFTKKTGTTVAFNFGGSDTLATQIKQGAPADVFASANEAQMRVVADAGLLAGQAKTFARNRLVIIVPKSNPAKINSLAGLANPGTKVVLAAPTVPVGKYAREAFRKVSGNGYPADFGGAVEKNVVSNELDVKAVATKIALGEGDAGVVYATDVTPQLASKVNTIPFPSGASPEVIYPIAVLKSAQNAGGAQAFMDFVLSDGQSFLRACGFIAP
jgi:molybdate transport system substrate-binding protein